MKWFDKPGATPTTPNDKAKKAIEYLKKSGDRPEKWAAVRQLLIFISKSQLDDSLIQEIITLKWNKLNYRIATNATNRHLQYLLDANLQDQKLFGIMIYNKNLSVEQAEEILERCDDSDRGWTNKKQLYRKYGVGEHWEV